MDLSGLTARSLLPFEPLFFEQGLTLISQVDEGITVSGDEEALRRVLEILLDNAQKYSSPGGETQVTLHRRGRNHCALTVAKPGEPIPPEAAARSSSAFTALIRPGAGMAASAWGCPLPRALWPSTTEPLT